MIIGRKSIVHGPRTPRISKETMQSYFSRTNAIRDLVQSYDLESLTHVAYSPDLALRESIKCHDDNLRPKKQSVFFCGTFKLPEIWEKSFASGTNYFEDYIFITKFFNINVFFKTNYCIDLCIIYLFDLKCLILILAVFICTRLNNNFGIF